MLWTWRPARRSTTSIVLAPPGYKRRCPFTSMAKCRTAAHAGQGMVFTRRSAGFSRACEADAHAKAISRTATLFIIFTCPTVSLCNVRAVRLPAGLPSKLQSVLLAALQSLLFLPSSFAAVAAPMRAGR